MKAKVKDYSYMGKLFFLSDFILFTSASSYGTVLVALLLRGRNQNGL